MIGRWSAIIGLAIVGGCSPNPRNEIGAIAVAATRETAKDAPGRRLCVDRVIAPWQTAAATSRIDPPAPPGFEELYQPGTFRGGGALKGADVGGVAVRSGADCFDLRGPLVMGNLAMIEVHTGLIGWNVWERRDDGGAWRVVMTTTSSYAA